MPEKKKFFISRADADKQWAELIASVVRDAGHQAIRQEDFPPGCSFIDSIRQASANSDCTIAVLSPAYFQSKYCCGELNSALALDPNGLSGRILPVLVSPCDRPPDVAHLNHVDLVGVKDDAARQRLMNALLQHCQLSDRSGPTAPDIGIEISSARPDIAWPEIATPLLWPMADHRGVQEAFESLLRRDAPWRYLPISGPSETGKSHITRQMLANALRTQGLACGRFDFKGTTDLDGELRVFVQDLDVRVPPASRQMNERLGDVLDELKRRARPALVILDTFEAAGGAQDWVEKQLLPSLIRLDWLRVVIAGQRVPGRAGAVWASAACPAIQLAPPPPADWFEHAKQYHDSLTLEDVETACRLARNKPSLLAQLLSPAT
jgi:hypothetical protein